MMIQYVLATGGGISAIVYRVSGNESIKIVDKILVKFKDNKAILSFWKYYS